jgi:ubiquinone/menaquinone biosynthesis C-methylase UbiE
MQEYYKEKCPSMLYRQMDARSLQFEDCVFDAVVDKGTLDSMLCGDGSGPNAEQMLKEIDRVLSPSGVYVCITYGVPEQRESYFKNSTFDWNVWVHKIPKPMISTSATVSNDDKDPKNFHYVYVMRKQVGGKKEGEGA